ncbi:MAG: carbohydrate binding family 9 domain-containing protein [Candidatus Aminicenantes bacterium]|nr:carbohydrate binding family 9 domain-containing protein [Candidatus Aminicenantes bacterium]
MKSKTKRTILFIFLMAVVFCLPGPAVTAAAGQAEQSAPEPSHRVPEVGGKISVDGKLDEPFWQKALLLTLDYEVTPGENIKPPVRTEFLLAYTRTHLYAAFRAYDPQPEAIRTAYADRDNFPDHDFVGLILDTFNEKRRTYNFYCNPFGIQADGIQGSQGWVEWDGIWDSTGRLTDRGYIVEMSIPFSTIRFQRKKGDQVWRFDAIRKYPRKFNTMIGYFPRDRSNFCYTCQMKELIGFAGAYKGKSLELDPTLSGLVTQERENFPAPEWGEKDTELDPGITARWGFTPNMTLSAAVNPDFSQVEADAAQLDINTQFALYYPEKRPFFMEGSSIFETGLPAVYTRTLADPEWGVKLTGKEGAHSVGFYSAMDSMTNLMLPGSQWSQATTLSMKTLGSVLRYRLDVGKISTLGLLLTDREGDDYFNRLAGFDAFFRLSKKKHVTFQFLTSQSRYPDQVVTDYGQPDGKFTGTALDFIFRHESRNLAYYLTYRQVAPDFRADLGFMPQVGYRKAAAGFALASWRNPGFWYTYLGVEPSFEYETDYDGNLLFKNYKLTCQYLGPAQATVILLGNIGKQSFLGNIFDNNYLSFMANVQPSGKLKLWLNGAYGDQIDFSNVRAGSKFLLNPGIYYKAGRHFSVSLDHIYEQLDIDAGRLYTADVTNLRLIYQFSRRAFLRTILQYVNYDYNSDNYLFPIDPEFKHFFTQVLFSYKINPQTVLFIGYSDDYYGYLQVPLTQSNRALFIKIGYALLL